MADYSDLAYSLSGLGKPANPYDQKRKFAYSMMTQGTDSSPVQSPWQGVSRLAQALVGGLMLNRTDSEEQAKNKERSDALAQAMAEPDPQKRIGLIAAYDPDAGARAAGSMAVEQAKLNQQQAMLEKGAGSFGGSYGMQPQQQGPQTAGAAPPGFANNVGNIRVSGAGWQDKGQPYNGFETFNTPDAGARAMYQNLSSYAQRNPNMTVGQAIATWAPPSENNTQAYVARIAQAGIDPNMPLGAVLKDPNVAGKLMMTMGMHEKGGLPQGFTPQTFTAAAGGQPQGAPQPYNGPQGDMVAPGMPPQPTPQGVNGPTVVAPPSVPQVPRPQPTPELLQQYQQRIKSGEFGFGSEAVSKARAALDADLDRQWNVQRDQAKMAYEAQLSSFGRRESQDLQQPQNNAQNESKMREQFDQLQSVKDYRKANTVFRSAVEASKVDSAAADLNMVYAFATLMDPGSVVRDSETQMVTATQNATDRIKALVATVSGGSRLSPQARSALLNEMGSRYQAYKTAHDDLANTFGGIADRTPGVNRQNVVVPYPDVGYEKPSVKQMPGNGGGTVSGLPGAADIDAELKRRGLAK